MDERSTGDATPYLIRFHALAPWSCGVKRVGGFTHSQDPVELLAWGTRAFVRCCGRRGEKNDGGIYQPPGAAPTFQILCGSRNGSYGIATFYPSSAPATCRD